MTGTPALATHTPALTPVATGSANIEAICPQITQGLPGNGLTSGELVMVDHDNNSLVWFDLQSGEHSPVASTSEQLLSYAVSPGGKWLAAEAQNLSSKKKRLIVLTAQGKQVVNLPWKDEWWKIAYWLDNQQLILNSNPYGNADLFILDPFTGEQKQLSIHSPQIYSLEYPPDWRGAGPIIYDPSLQRAVFAGANDVYYLWDVEDGKSLASVQTISFLQFPTKAPQWSPDGSQVLLAAPNKSLDYANDELFSINSTGAITKLTDLMSIYSKASIDRYNWSPDRQYAALFFEAAPSKYIGERLALLNPSTKEFTSYCIQGDVTGNYRKNIRHLYDDQIYTGVLWSPDSQQIIVENRVADNLSKIILVDIAPNIAFDVMDGNFQPIGWMVSGK